MTPILTEAPQDAYKRIRRCDMASAAFQQVETPRGLQTFAGDDDRRRLTGAAVWLSVRRPAVGPSAPRSVVFDAAR